jgi:ribosomal protein S18 acetylase RimI-like enzyme
MIFATASLARRIERAETTLIGDSARSAARRARNAGIFISDINGGVAACVEPDSPFNKVAGLGFDGVPEAKALDEVERAFDAQGQPVRVEIATLADPAVAQAFTRRGYDLIGFENVLGLTLDQDMVRKLASSPLPERLAIAETTAEDERAWADTVITGFLHPDAFDGPASDQNFPRDVLERTYADMAASGGFARYLARFGEAVAGGAGLRVFDNVAQLCGAATLPAFRRRGVQSALLRRRLVDAGSQGCDLAVVTTQPGSKSQENVQRFGFELLYSRAVLVGLVGVRS